MPTFLVNRLDPALDILGTLTQAATSTLGDEPNQYGGALAGQTGAVANITVFASPLVTLTGLTGMTTQSVGRFLTISGAATGANNGTFLIAEYVSATSVKVVNASGVAPDANNGAITWTERAGYSLQDDLNFIRTDRRLIKGTTNFYDAVPTYERPTAVGTPVPANLTNIAAKTTDAKALTVSRKAENATAKVGELALTVAATSALQHATTTNRTGVPIQDGADAANLDACYVEIINPATEDGLLVLGGGNAGQRIYGFTRVGTPVAATGSITTIAGASLVDGETFTLNDGINAATIFEFDSGGGVTPGNVAVAFTGGDSADVVRDSIIAAVNGVGAGLLITASNGGAATVTLTRDNVGYYNIAITETVANVGFVVSGMSGGSGSASPDSVEVKFYSIAPGAPISTANAYTWEAGQPTTVDLFYGYRERLDNLNDTALRTTLTNGIVGDAQLRQELENLRDVIDTGLTSTATSLTGLLTNTGSYYVFSNLPDGTPSVVEALNTLNAQIGIRDYTGTILTDGQTITASLQALANAISGATFVRTIERLTADIDAGTPHTLPGGQTYTLDGTNNGQNLTLFWRGMLRDPGPVVDGNDYAETSTTQFTPYSKIKDKDHINYYIYA
jgi:hypothetical protein